MARVCHAVQSEQDDADVIVVGSGMAGMCAAIAAAQRGASVVVLDRFHGGGASYLSGGVVYAGGGTRHQVAAGYGHDSPADLLAYLRQEVGSSGVVDDATLARFCDGSAASLAWLESLGAPFAAALCPYKTSYPTDRHHLYFSGSEKATALAERARPAPRGHRAVGKGLSGSYLWRPIFDSALRMGVRFQAASRVEKVVMDESGRAAGVEVRVLREGDPAFAKHKKLSTKARDLAVGMLRLSKWYSRRAEATFRQHARPHTMTAKAVVLAAGGFAMNDAMTAQHMPTFHLCAPLGTAGDDGSGIKLGQAAGGSVSHLDRFTAWRFLSPPTAFLEGVAVSPTGQRIAAEDLYGASFTETMLGEHGGKGFLIVDSKQWAKAKAQMGEQSQAPVNVPTLAQLYWSHRKADSLEALAKKLGISADGVRGTVDAYNGAIAAGVEDPVRKTDEYRVPITEPPFYGVDVSCRSSGLGSVPALTLGGLRVDGESGLVLDDDDGKIQGLYAAGRNAVGICSNRYVSGLSLADCVFSGRRAGEHAAAAVQQEKR